MIAGALAGMAASVMINNQYNRSSSNDYYRVIRREEDKIEEAKTKSRSKKTTKTILSIDCDVMFSCNTYAEYMNYDLDPELAWDIVNMIKDRHDSNIDLEIDSDTVNVILDLIILNPTAEVVIINEHDEILEHMSSSYKWRVFNADFHHDITYDGDDNELNIENWVRHGFSKGLISEYNWLHRTMSEHPKTRAITYKSDNINQISPRLMPKIDKIVICVSKHFTPKEYWKTLPNVLLSYFKHFEKFQEVHPESLTESMIKEVPNYKDYLADDTMPDTYRLFRDKNSYLILEKQKDYGLSMISLDGKANLFHIKEVVDYLLRQYGSLRFDYIPGIRNEVFIKRLVRNYTIISEGEGYYKIKLKR